MTDEPGPERSPAGTAIPRDADVIDPVPPLTAARAAHAKGGEDIVVLQVAEVMAITDYFVIASASNHRLVRAVVNDIEEQVGRATGEKPLRVEGLSEGEWVLMDYGVFVVHVFHAETRRYYELERLWADVPVVDWTPEVAPEP